MPFHKKSIVYSRSTIVNKPAFTLIELLVVIAIIGILAALATVSFADSQQKSRDTRRKQDLEAIRKALELAKQDSAGSYSYPGCRTPATSCTIVNTDDASSSTNGNTNPDLIGTNFTYIKAVPIDPKAGTPYTLIPTPDPCASGLCTAFTLVACLENKKDPQRDTADTCAAADTVSYTISNL